MNQTMLLDNGWSALKNRNVQMLLVLSILLLSFFYMPEVWANNLDNLGKNLVGKVRDISDVLKTLAAALFSVGILWIVFSLLKGEPNYRYAITLVVGGTILFVSDKLLIWLTK